MPAARMPAAPGHRTTASSNTQGKQAASSMGSGSPNTSCFSWPDSPAWLRADHSFRRLVPVTSADCESTSVNSPPAVMSDSGGFLRRAWVVLRSRACRWPVGRLPLPQVEGSSSRRSISKAMFESAHPVPDSVGMAEQDAGRLAGGAAIVEPGAEGSEQDGPLAGRDLAQRGQDAAGDVPHHLRVAARHDGEQVAVEDCDVLSGECAAQRDSGQPEVPGGVPEIVVARADPDQARAERVEGIRQAGQLSLGAGKPGDPDFGIVQEPPRRDHPDAPERRLRLRDRVPSGAWRLRGDNDVTTLKR